MSKNAEVMKFFLELCPEGLGRTRMIKLLYLADLEARKATGKPITDLEYIWHHHGPFDKKFFDAIGELQAAKQAQPQVIDYGSGMVEKRLINVDGDWLPETLDDAECAILEYVANRYMAVKLRDLLDEVVYKSRPMREVGHRGETLPMDIVDNASARRAGFDFAEVIAIERAMLDGEYVVAVPGM